MVRFFFLQMKDGPEGVSGPKGRIENLRGSYHNALPRRKGKLLLLTSDINLKYFGSYTFFYPFKSTSTIPSHQD